MSEKKLTQHVMALIVCGGLFSLTEAKAETLQQVSFQTPFLTPWDAPNLLSDRLSWGGEYVNQTGTKEASNDGAAEQFTGQELKLGIAAQPFEQVSGLLTLKWQKAFLWGAPDKASQLGFESAYVSWLDAAGEPLVSLGRYYYEDSRGFLFHQSVDGVHGQTQWQSPAWDWQAVAFVGRQGVWKENLLEAGTEDTSFRFLQAQARNEQLSASAYVFSRETHTADNDSPLLFGVRSSGQLTDNLDHWLELMVARGESGTAKIRGYGADVGGVWRWNDFVSGIAGIAYGSGDKASDTVDERFRQTGLQLNNGWIGKGGAKLKYYGELTKPELSNIGISTLGVRFTPRERVSVEVLYHRYRQAQADTEFHGYGLRDDPNGIDRGLGQELDLVIAYRGARGMKLELNLAHFQPGKAFGVDAKPLSMAYVEARFRF